MLKKDSRPEFGRLFFVGVFYEGQKLLTSKTLNR